MLAATGQRMNLIFNHVYIEFVGNEVYYSPAVEEFRGAEFLSYDVPTAVSNILNIKSDNICIYISKTYRGTPSTINDTWDVDASSIYL